MHGMGPYCRYGTDNGTMHGAGSYHNMVQIMIQSMTRRHTAHGATVVAKYKCPVSQAFSIFPLLPGGLVAHFTPAYISTDHGYCLPSTSILVLLQLLTHSHAARACVDVLAAYSSDSLQRFLPLCSSSAALFCIGVVVMNFHSSVQPEPSLVTRIARLRSSE